MQRKRPGRLRDTVSVCLFPVPSCNSFVCVCVVVVVEVVEGTRFALLLRSLVLSLSFSLSSFLSEPVPLFLRILSLSFSLLRWRDLESPPFGFVLARLLGLLLPSGVVSSSAPLSVLGMPQGTGCNRARVSVARECMRAPLHRHRAVGAPCAESSPLPLPPLLSCTWQWLTNPCVGVSLCVCAQ